MTAVAAAFALALGVAACGDDDGGDDASAGTSGGGTGEAARDGDALDGEPIRIGGVYDLTGPLSFLGEPGAAGAQAYIDELNEGGGIDGRPVEFILKNGESTSDAAIAGFRELLTEGVVAVLGPPSGTTASAILPIANEAEVPVLSPQGALDLTEGYMFTLSLGGSRTLENFAQYFVDEGIEQVGWLVAGDALGQTQSDLARPIFDDLGIEVVSEQTINPTANDYTTQLAVLRDEGAEAVYAIGSGAAVVTAAQGFDDLDMPGFIVVQNASVAQISLFGDAAEDVRVPQPKVAVLDQIAEDDPLRAPIEEFVAVAEDHDVPVDLFGAGGYSGARIVTEVVAEVGDDPAAIYEHLIDDFEDEEHLGGRIHWTEDDHGCCGLNAWVWTTPDVAADRFTVLRAAE